MAGDDLLFHIRVKAHEAGWEGDGDADAEIFALTPDTALVRVNPITPWNGDALHRLSVALEVVAQTLRRAEGKP